MKIFLRNILYFLFMYLAWVACKPATTPAVIIPFDSLRVVTAWADMTLFITRNTFANTPTYSSRALGYIGLTMYESIVGGFKDYKSLSNQLNGLSQLPSPAQGKKYNWLLSLNAAQSYILKNIYQQTSDENKTAIDSLEKIISDYYASNEADTEVVTRSADLGRSIAAAIYVWSQTDGGHRAYLHNFDTKFNPADKPGSWKPAYYSQVPGHYPLHPTWGSNRLFLKNNEQIPLPEFIPHSPSNASGSFKQFSDVYSKNSTLTQEEKEIAIWWNDDPSETFTPPGHSYNLGTTVIKKARPDLIKCAQTYASIGMAVADAFVKCWKWKYTVFSERPSSYINSNMNPAWESFWPNPPFPAFPSGHAIQAAATATVMTKLYGDHFIFTDSSHAGKSKDQLRNVEYKPRHYSSFWQVAEETANSRFYGGIHTRQDNTAGLQAGKKIGNSVTALKWEN